ncbi:Rad9-domain-containing protein [Piromyces finnis]|uniref:Cell cycle checkpoint control protein RAD9A n=1 Tax=Piromyces finnis TaxID=1754191 RepID=A0A1Y1VCN0_9FUNG|nr:Rad9-domain-containing protein [Piromyces finnis]|eukprot:ORX52617.1 Rad9-domain-containing protein [Piromyces finnis]
MELVISGNSIKPFSKFLSSLIKIGDYVNFEAKKEKFLLSTVNSSRSAFSIFTVYPKFFDQYNINENIIDTLSCRILLKPLVNIFKLKNSNENTIEKCEIKFKTNPETTRTLVINLDCKYGIKKTHYLNYEDSDIMHAIYQKNTINRWVATPRLIREWLNHFYHRLEEISMVCIDGIIKFKSFIDDSVAKEDLTDRPLQTEIIIDPSEFELFNVVYNVELTFNFRELKAILYFGEALGYPVKAFFERDGQPIIFTVNSSNLFEADFVLATLTHDDDNEYNQSQSSQLNAQYQFNNNGGSQASQNTQNIRVNPTPPSQIENDFDRTRIKQEFNDYDNTEKVLQDLGINIDDVMLDNNLLDTSMEMDMDTETNLSMNIDSEQSVNKEINITTKQEKHNLSTEASTSTAPSSSESRLPNNRDDINNSEFKVPESKKIIKREITDNTSYTLIKSSQQLHNVKSETIIPGTILTSAVKTKLNNEQNDDNEDDYEICPPSPEENIVTSIFSSQFDKELSKTKQNNENEIDKASLGEVISSTPFKRPRMLFE